MYKVKHSRRKPSLVATLSLGFMILGISCITWAMFNIWAQSGNATNIRTDKTLMSGYTLEDINVESETSLILAVQDKTLYPIYPVEGDNIGTLTIPALKRRVPIFQGTGDKELKQGVGHFLQSVLPGEEDNCVFSGHRETAFRQISNLKTGDQLIVDTSAGTFTYEVKGTRIVHQDDRTVIVPTADAVLTLTTCYPFNFIGDAPDRYIVSAILVESK